MKHRACPIPYKDIGQGRCQWCAKTIREGRRDRRWHDGRVHASGTREPDCRRDYFIATSRDTQIYELRRLDLWWCAACGRPPQSYVTQPNYGLRWRGALRLNMGAELWRQMSTDETIYAGGRYVTKRTRMLEDPLEAWPRMHNAHRDRDLSPWWFIPLPWVRIAHELGVEGEHDQYLEVDHIVPLIDCDHAGIGMVERFGITNLQALCLTHHKAKTKREAAARAARRRAHTHPTPSPQEALFA